MTAIIVLKTARAYLPLLLGAVALVGGLLAFILAVLLYALLLLVGGGRRARVDAVAAALLALAALATAVVVGGLVGRLLQVIGMVVPVSAELSFAFVLRKREVFFDCFVKVLAGKGDGHEGEDQQEGQLHSSIRSTFGSSVYIDSMVGMLLGSICFACVLRFMAGRCFASLTPAPAWPGVALWRCYASIGGGANPRRYDDSFAQRRETPRPQTFCYNRPGCSYCSFRPVVAVGAYT